jgi:radical SAM superfamily enzyme
LVDTTRVLPDSVVVHRLSQNLPEADVGLRRNRRAALLSQGRVPTSNQFRSELSQRDVAKGRNTLGKHRQDVQAKL